MHELFRMSVTMSSYFLDILFKGVQKRSIAYIQTFGLLLTKIGHELSFVGAMRSTMPPVRVWKFAHRSKYFITTDYLKK